MFPVAPNGFAYPSIKVKDHVFDYAKEVPIDLQSTLDRQSYNWVSYYLATSIRRLMDSYGLSKDLFGLMPQLLGNVDVNPPEYPRMNSEIAGLIYYPSPYKNSVKPKKGKIYNNALDPTKCLKYLIDDEFDSCIEAIKLCQSNGIPIFTEFYYFLAGHWDVISELYTQTYHSDLPSRSEMKDAEGHYDALKFIPLFKDERFLLTCLNTIFEGYTSNTLYPRYGLSLELLIRGATGLFSVILNQQTHPFDAIFLKHVLPNFIYAGTDAYLVAIDASAAHIYWDAVEAYLRQLDDYNFQDFRPLNSLNEYYQLVRDGQVCSLISRYQEGPELGDKCLIRMYLLNVKASLMFRPEHISTTMVPEVTDSLKVPFSRKGKHVFKLGQATGREFDEAVFRPLLQYIMSLMVQVPDARWKKYQFIIGPMLRKIFDGRLEWIHAPLSPDEQRLARDLLQTQAWHPLLKSLQSHHMGPLLQTGQESLKEVSLLPEGFIILGQSQTSSRFYQGSTFIYMAKPLAHMVDNRQTSIKIDEIYKLWFQTFSFFDAKHRRKIPYVNAKLGNSILRITPSTTVVKQDKTGLAFYPLVIGDEGVYCHLSTGANLKPAYANSVRYICSGTCLLGGDMVGVMQTPNGLEHYKLLDAHAEAPKYPITDITYQHSEHPEETLYLLMQQTLAPFYKDIYKDQAVVFYLHDVSQAYLCYLIPHYLSGVMSKETLLKGIDIICQRQALMAEKLSKIFEPYHIPVTLFSSLQSIKIEWLLDIIDTLDARTAEDKETALKNMMLNFMITDATVPKEVRAVYTYVLQHPEIFENQIKEKGLRWISILDYMVQFAILNEMSGSSVLCVNQSIEYKIAEGYESCFAPEFSSIINFLWMNPIALRHNPLHNRLYFIDENIPETVEFIRAVTHAINQVIAHRALDEPFELKDKVAEIQTQLAKAPRFFTKSESTTALVPKRKTEPPRHS